jgi:hypothetical protein
MPKKILIPPYSRNVKNPPYEDVVTEDLRERMREGPVTLSKPEIQRIIAMLETYANRCGEAYQVVGQVADFAGVHENPAVVKAMDLLADPLRRGEILPFGDKFLKAGTRVKVRPRHMQMSRGEPKPAPKRKRTKRS